jgi:hypothetical protein
MTTLESLFFTFVFAYATVYDLKSFVWSISTQEVMITKTKNQAKTVKNVLNIKWLPFEGQFPTHDL